MASITGVTSKVFKSSNGQDALEQRSHQSDASEPNEHGKEGIETAERKAPPR